MKEVAIILNIKGNSMILTNIHLVGLSIGKKEVDIIINVTRNIQEITLVSNLKM